MNLKPVVTSLFLMGLACGTAMAEGYDGDVSNDTMSDLEVVDATVDVSDVDMNNDNVVGAVSPQVTISGKVNADYTHRDFKKNPDFGYMDPTALLDSQSVEDKSEPDGRIAGNVQLNIDASLGGNDAHLGLIYSLDENNGSTIKNDGKVKLGQLGVPVEPQIGNTKPGQLDVAEAYVRMLNLGGTPLTLKFGHGFTDFGKSGANQGDFERYPVVRSLTQSLSQTSANFVQLGLSDLGLKGIHVSGYVLDHKNANDIGNPFDEKDNQIKDKVGTYGVNFGYNFFTNFLSQEQWGINIGLVTNPGAVELVEGVHLNSAKNSAVAVDFHGSVDDAEIGLSFVKYGKIYNKTDNDKDTDRRTLPGDSIEMVPATEVFGTSISKDDAPSAFDIKLGYSFRDTFGPGADTKLAFGYGHGQDSVRLFLPQSQIEAGVTQGLGSGADLNLTYVHQTNYDKKDENGDVMKADGKELKGASNNIIALRLSYSF